MTKRKALPGWIPWLIAAVSALSGIAFNVYDRAVQRGKVEGQLQAIRDDLTWARQALIDIAKDVGATKRREVRHADIDTRTDR